MEKKKIKILYVNHIGNVMGGAEHSLAILLKNLNKEVFSPLLLLPDYGPVYDYFISIGIETYVVPINYLWLPSDRQYYRLLKDFKTRLNWFNEIITKEDIDIIHTNDEEAFDGAIAAKIHSIPHIWHIRHRFINNAQPVFNYFPLHEFGMGNFINEFSDRVVAVSEDVKKDLNPYIEPKKLSIVYGAIETDKYEIPQIKNDIRKELGFSADTFLVCSAGRICKGKGFDVYIDAAAHVLKHCRNVKFLIVGEEVQKDLVSKLKKQINELQIEGSIYFLGYRQDFPEILQQIDIFTLTSVNEGLSRVIVEASRARKPVIATRCGGSGEAVLDGESGYLVSLNRADLVAEKIIDLLNKPQLRLEMGEKGRRIVKEKFSAEIHIKNIEAVYYELLRTHQNGGKVNILPRIFINLLGEIGDIGMRLIDYEDRIKRLESFQDGFKNNFLYKGTKKIYSIFKNGQHK